MIISKGTKISSFTIFEVTMVLAIMSVLILIITLSTNRFNEQLKISNDIKSELNAFQLLRANLSKDFYHADQVRLKNGELILTKELGEIKYTINDGFLSQVRGNETISLNILVTDIFETSLKEVPVYHIIIPWKNEELDLSFYYKPSVDLAINTFFEEYNER